MKKKLVKFIFVKHMFFPLEKQTLGQFSQFHVLEEVRARKGRTLILDRKVYAIWETSP